MGNVGKDTLHGAPGTVQELRNNELPKLFGISSNLLVFLNACKFRYLKVKEFVEKNGSPGIVDEI